MTWLYGYKFGSLQLKWFVGSQRCQSHPPPFICYSNWHHVVSELYINVRNNTQDVYYTMEVTTSWCSINIASSYNTEGWLMIEIYWQDVKQLKKWVHSYIQSVAIAYRTYLKGDFLNSCKMTTWLPKLLWFMIFFFCSWQFIY